MQHQSPINEALIKKFFNGLCTKEEAEQVLAFLKNNPDHPYLMGEWDNADNETALPGNYTQAMYDAIEKRMQPEKKTRGWAVMLAAAAILSAVAIIWWPAKKAIVQQPLAETNSTPVHWIEKTNNTNAMQVLLPGDGSRISLMPGSSVRYAEGFGQTAARTVYMQGEAVFDVFKNKQKPFVVYSNYINTTALGTSFRITARVGEDKIKVRLVEGKVVVKLNDSSIQKIHSDYYMQAGQELFFKSSNLPAVLYAFNNKPAGNIKQHIAIADTAGVNRDVEYMFNNQTLADVLDHLSGLYGVSIQYSKAEIGKNYFIGKIEKTDSLEKTIRDIAVLNGLSVTKQNGGYILKKKKR
ncbi:MAG: FecR family protein [Chitinophagaceae bacterium]